MNPAPPLSAHQKMTFAALAARYEAGEMPAKHRPRVAKNNRKFGAHRARLIRTLISVPAAALTQGAVDFLAEELNDWNEVAA
jgi:hypothetical protein